MIEWRLGEVLTERGIMTVSDFQKRLEAELGLCISRQALAKLLDRTPKEIRLETMQALSTLLDCPLSRLLEVHPEPKARGAGVIQPYARIPKRPGELFADPGLYL